MYIDLLASFMVQQLLIVTSLVAIFYHVKIIDLRSGSYVCIFLYYKSVGEKFPLVGGEHNKSLHKVLYTSNAKKS